MNPPFGQFPVVDGPVATFGSTHWSVILSAANGGAPEATSAFETLYRAYAAPLYVYVRRQGHSPEEASELVQELFLVLLRNNQLAFVSPDKGRFRSYLMSCANHLLANDWKKAHRAKRGGDAPSVSLDGMAEEERYRVEPIERLTPEIAYERRWASALLDRAYQRVRLEWHESGKGAAFERLGRYVSGDHDAPGYPETARELGWSEGSTRVAVHRLRQRFRDLVRCEIARTVENPEDIEDEWRHLIHVLRQ